MVGIDKIVSRSWVSLRQPNLQERAIALALLMAFIPGGHIHVVEHVDLQ